MTDSDMHDSAPERKATSGAARGAQQGDTPLAEQAGASPTAGDTLRRASDPDIQSADGRDQAADLGDSSGDAVAESGEATSEQPGDQSAGDESAGDAAAPEEIEAVPEEEVLNWYILKVQVNREDSIRDALIRRVKILGLERFVGDIVVPTEDVAEFNKSGKRRIVKRKLYPGYLLVNMAINDETWFLIRETPGIGDFTGSGGRPTPMETRDVERILRLGAAEDEGGSQVKTAIPFTTGDRVRVKDGYFQNFEGEVNVIDQANGRITVMINIFGRSTPVELEHWQVESV